MKQNDPDAEFSDETDSDDEQGMEFDGGFKVPGKLWKKLYRYKFRTKLRVDNIRTY